MRYEEQPGDDEWGDLTVLLVGAALGISSLLAWWVVWRVLHRLVFN